MDRPWLKWESDLGSSRREITVPQAFAGKSGTVIEDVENAGLGILLDDVAAGSAALDAPQEKTVTVIAQDAAVDVSLLVFDPDPGEDERAEAVAELARNRVLDRK